jgi:triphosphoribosyl-dephospho-CoA synthase
MSPRNIERHVRLACLMEATARKPGNVHPAASFDDLCYRDLVVSAAAIAPIVARSRELGVGRTILDAATRTRQAVGRNTNLGIILLLVPLASVDPNVSLAAGISDVLKGLTQADAARVYQAIRVANPGGMGEVATEDISREPTTTLLQTMQLAEDRDLIAKQYASGFDLVLKTGVSILAANDHFSSRWEEAVITLHLKLMSLFPDTLIARKCGIGEAQQSADLAQEVLAAGWPASPLGREKLGQLDRWLRENGHSRNPGTTADLVTACLFAALRDGSLEPPDAIQPQP